MQKFTAKKWFSRNRARAVLATMLFVVGTLLGTFNFSPLVAAQQAQRIRVALFIDDGTEAGEFKKEFRRNDDESITYKKIDGADVRNGALNDFDVFLMPGGSARGEAHGLGKEGQEKLVRFIENGGIYMGVCAGAYLVSSERRSDLGLLPLTCPDGDHWFRVNPDNEASVQVELTPAGQEIFGIDRSPVKITYCNGPIFSLPKERSGQNNLVPLGFFRSEVVADGGTPGVMLGAPAMILARYGKGVILAISPHPEETPGLKQVELHAIRWLYEHRSNPMVAVQNNSVANAINLRSNVHLVEGEPARTRANSLEKSNTENHEAPSSVVRNKEHEPADLNAKALKFAQSIFDNASEVRYVHNEVPARRQVITEPDGSMIARTDCSGFISYIVDSMAARHYKVVRSLEPGHAYPQAKVWASFFNTLDSQQAHDGWLAISDWRNLKPGDFIAWKEGGANASNTGHVMLAAGKPSAIQQSDGYRYFEIQVIDSSSVYHFQPEYLPPKASQRHRNGVGVGCIRIILSDTNEPIGYWAGTYWGEGQKPVRKPTYSKLVRFARMVSLQE